MNFDDMIRFFTTAGMSVAVIDEAGAHEVQPTPDQPPLFTDADVIHVHTRAQLLSDGDLIDVTETACEAGVRWPVALTRAAHADCVAWTRTDLYQDEPGRLWDVLSMLVHRLRLASHRDEAGDALAFVVYRLAPDATDYEPTVARLVARVDGGDDGEPVITVLLEGED